MKLFTTTTDGRTDAGPWVSYKLIYEPSAQVSLKCRRHIANDIFPIVRVSVLFSDTQGQLTLPSVVDSGRNSKSSKILWLLLTCKNEKDLIKNDGARVLTRLYIDFSEAQGQLTPHSVVESGQNWNSSKLLWLFLLPARMKKIQSKMKALES